MCEKLCRLCGFGASAQDAKSKAGRVQKIVKMPWRGRFAAALIGLIWGFALGSGAAPQVPPLPAPSPIAGTYHNADFPRRVTPNQNLLVFIHGWRDNPDLW